jgi:uncharacterized protein (TIGR00290 family)
MKVVAAWSGGKDSCFAYYKAVQQNLEVVSLLTFMADEGTSNFHAIPVDFLKAQAAALGVPLALYVTTPQTYESIFKDVLKGFKENGVEGLVTGDIYEVAGHEERWLERICAEVGLKPIRPLWQGDTKEIFKEYLAAGFKATVVRTNLTLMGTEWLGRQLDESFYNDVLKLGNVDACGEGGEFHTVVTDGPNFQSRIELVQTKKSTEGNYSHLDIEKFKVVAKN